MLQFISVDSGRRHALVPPIIGKDHGQILVEYAHHSFR